MSRRSCLSCCDTPVVWEELYSRLGSVHRSHCTSHSGNSVINMPVPETPFSELQALCHSLRSSVASSPLPSHPYHQQVDLNSSYQSLHNSCHLPMHQHSRPFISPTIPQDDYLCDAEVGGYMGQVDGNIIDDDIGADWFDEEILGHETPNWKFDWPVPTEPVLPMTSLRMVQFGGSDGDFFYVNDEGYVQVYTQGENREPFVEKGSIGVWFGPDHPKNISERMHSGRRTQEAARFQAVIEAIKTAGDCGINKIQINTDYINIVQFMLYFIWKWENNGWMTIHGTPVRNRVLIEELDYYSKLLDVKWNYVPAEDKVEGNLEADKLAQAALGLVYKARKTRANNTTGNAAAEPPADSASQETTAPKRKWQPIRFNPY